jgi:hypothetical protein
MFRIIFILTLLFTSFNAFSQDEALQSAEPKDTANYVTFVIEFDKAEATKDGVYLNGYIVEMNYKKAKKLKGKTIKVSGYVTIEKGLNNFPKEYDSNGREIIRQGRVEDTRHILNPVIQIIN